jgi:hypothetical protein
MLPFASIARWYGSNSGAMVDIQNSIGRKDIKSDNRPVRMLPFQFYRSVSLNVTLTDTGQHVT